jgi:hypothetical protein
MACASPSSPPPALRETRAKHLPLRAGGERVLNPRRDWARRTGLPIRQAVLDGHRVSNVALAESFGLSTDKAGAENRSGSVAVTTAEDAYLLDLDVTADLLLSLLLDRLQREASEASVFVRPARLQLLDDAARLLRAARSLILNP